VMYAEGSSRGDRESPLYGPHARLSPGNGKSRGSFVRRRLDS
jgi:hypothetical protein